MSAPKNDLRDHEPDALRTAGWISAVISVALTCGAVALIAGVGGVFGGAFGALVLLWAALFAGASALGFNQARINEEEDY